MSADFAGASHLVLHHAYAVFSGSTPLFGSNALPTMILP